jgi:hypothetical protein
MAAQANNPYMNGSKQFGNVENLFGTPGRNKNKKDDEDDVDSLFAVNSAARKKK